MPKTLRVLHVEDQERDVALLTRHLSRAGYDLLSERVDTAAAMRSALETQEWNVILCDYSMPQFSAVAALALVREMALDLPFIIISGTVGEAVAVEAMRAGAHDYLMKDNLARLAPIIERELQEKDNRRARRLAEATLRESEDRYRDLVEHSHDLICTHDLAGRLLSVNQSAATALGYDRNDLLGRNIREALLPEFRAGFADYLEKLQREGIAHGLMTVLTSSGQKRVWEYTNTLRTEGVDNPIVRGVAHDVTEQKIAEAALRRSEEQYRILFDSNPLPMWVYDLETLQFLAVNKAAIMHYGYSHEEFLAMTIKDIRPAEDVPALLDNIEHVAGGFDRAGTWRHQKKDGSLIDVEITSHLIHFSDRPAEIVLANDVTERRRAEEALHKINETLKTFIRASPLAIVALDMERKVTLWNPAAERMFGWTEAEVMGQISPTIPEPDMTSQLSLRAEFLSSTLTISNMETRRLRKDGSTVEVSISVAALRDPANEIIGTIGIIADITERKQAEAELKDSHQRLEQTLAELRRKSEELTAMTEQLWQASKLATMGELAASIAHELNNPLATVALRTESLIMQLREDEPKRRALEIVAQEVDRMASLVNNLLQFSRRSHRQVSTVDVCDEIANSVDFVSFHLRSHRIEVVRDFVAALPTIQADRQQLRQLFLNLLTNASDAMPHGGTLTLTARSGTNESEEGAVVIEFADTGEGIAPADLEKIWDPFFTTKPEGRGTGLGLGICRRIIEEHGGTIAIESEIGKGTIVRIVFPATSNGVVARLL